MTNQRADLTPAKKVIFAATLAAAVGLAVYKSHLANSLNTQLQALREHQARVEQTSDERHRELDQTATRLSALLQDNDRLRRAVEEVHMLRGQVAQLLSDSQELSRRQVQEVFGATESELRSWLSRTDKLKGWLDQRPEAGIPELTLITERDWLDATREEIETEEDYRRAMGVLCELAKNRFAKQVQTAAAAWKEYNPSRVPQELSELNPFFDSPVSEAVLDGWSIGVYGKAGNWIITQTRPSPLDYDTLHEIHIRGGADTAPAYGGEPSVVRPIPPPASQEGGE
jgi:TolA-binding protein